MIKVLKSAATEAGTILLKYYKKNLTLNYKTSHKDFYTIADVESQKAIKEIITKLLLKKGINESEIGFIGEEKLHVDSKRKHLFVIDPLDGTVNFAFGFDFFSISIAYFYDGKLTAGMVYQPTNKKYYYSTLGKGAFVNGKHLEIAYKPLKQCLLSGLISSRPEIYTNLFKTYQKIYPHVAGYRNLNSMAIDNCLLTENVFNIVVNAHTFIWDISATKLIIEESGGIMIDFKGLPIDFDLNHPQLAYNVISCHPGLKNEILSFFK
ncbi:MAG: inositol monophosphatase family protein [Patescibacteria group bacterium]|jgi:myo-inositol-1(or 4)-monophosphatase